MDYHARSIRTITDFSEVGVGVGDDDAGTVHVYVSLPHEANRACDDQWIALSLECARDLYLTLRSLHHVFATPEDPRRPLTVDAGAVELVCEEALREFRRCKAHGAPWTHYVQRDARVGATMPVYCALCAPPEAVDSDFAHVVRTAVRLLAAAKAVP
jgi:hypothetical protein